MQRQGLTLVETLVAIAILGLLVSVALPTLARSLETSHRNTCQANLKELGMALKVYGSENRARLPRMHGDQSFGPQGAASGCDPASLSDLTAFAPDMRAIYPEYLTDPTALICPSAAYEHRGNPLGIVHDDGSGRCRFTGQPTRADAAYQYLGYTLDRVDGDDPALSDHPLGPGQLVGLLASLAPVLFNHDPLDDALLDRDIDLSAVGLGGQGFGNSGRDIILRLELGSAQFTPHAPNMLPVMWDRVSRAQGGEVEYNHTPNGSNVLYLDGHVAFTGFANDFPVSSKLSNLAAFY